MLGAALLVAVLVAAVASAAAATSKYPVPTPKGGRFDVHGWLILPMDQPHEATTDPVPAWFSHHVPEFWTESPHNWQIMVRGHIVPTPCVEGELFPIAIPRPPLDDLITYEYSITPPSPFSLNDLLNGDIKKLNGVYFNGSFDTPYERIPQSLAYFTIDDLTTTTYLSEFETETFPNLRYLSYPRSLKPGASSHFYLAHEIHAQPDFDHVVHATLTHCSINGTAQHVDHVVTKPGISWELVGVPNTLEHKLIAGQSAKVQLVQNSAVSCTMKVEESLHCMIGPGFMDNC